MQKVKNIGMVLKPKPTLEGAGVRLNPVFGFDESPKLDLFREYREGTFVKHKFRIS